MHVDKTPSDSQLTPLDETSNMTLAHIDIITDKTFDNTFELNEAGPQSLPAVLPSVNLSNDKFKQYGVYVTDDQITVDVGTLPSTQTQNRKQIMSKIPRSPINVRRRSLDNSSCSGSLQDLYSRTDLTSFNRKAPTYRSVRNALPNAAMKNKISHTNTEKKSIVNTWNAPLVGNKRRPTINADTFSSPFERNVKTRSTHVLYDSNGRRIKGCTASLTTSPTKNQVTSPLAQQLLEAASCAKNDAQILEKMKDLLSRYSAGNNSSSSKIASNNKKTQLYEDFTTAWVQSNGNLERSKNCSPTNVKISQSKKSSVASSTESTHSHDMSLLVSPRRERGTSKIPGPVRQKTELF